MSRLSKILLLIVLVTFTLACNFINQKVDDVKNDIENTVQAVTTSIPFETLQAVSSALPMETLQALPSSMPDFGNMFNPQGEPVAEWNGIPIMPQATAGQEHDANNYSFKFAGTAKEASDFYNNNTMSELGWSPMLSMPGDENGALLVFQKDNGILTITVTTTDGNTVVLLTVTQ